LKNTKRFSKKSLVQRTAGDEAISKPLAKIENWAVVEGVVSQRFEALQREIV
jgi:hypothetical protein